MSVNNKRYILVLALIILAGNLELIAAQDSFLPAQEPDTELIAPGMMTGNEKIIFIRDRWRFMPGDNPEWADPDFDDSEWEFLSTNLIQADLSFIEWDGLGWFRKKFEVDSQLAGKPLALLIDRHLGASEVYLNGEKIHELGSFSTYPEEVENYSRNAPLVIIFPDREVSVIAVRFINPAVTETGKYLGYNGFRFLLGDWETHQTGRYSYLTQWTSSNMFYIGILLAFAIIHLLLFVFYPVEKRNLYFSLFVIFLAALSYFFYRVELSDYTFEAFYYIQFILIMEVMVLAFAAIFTHSIDKEKTPFYSKVLIFVAIIAAILVWFFPFESVWLREILVIVLILEIFRSVGVMLYKNMKGVWVLGVGILMFVFGLIYSIMVNFEIINGNVQYGNMIGAGFLVLSMSIYLSREFANTQKSLENKLEEVKILSEKTLTQEKINKEREIEKRLLEAENERKGKELEEARTLQLSMLPQKMPVLSEFDLSVFMETATEVGGDYYDYSVGENEKLVLVLGDATGHGMKAGIMVAAAKSYFHTLVHEYDSITMLQRMSSGLRNLNMRMMYMGMMLVHCNKNYVEISTAGMPPALCYKSNEDNIEIVRLKGLPLGSNVDFPYQSQRIEMESGDVLFMMSDGLCELFNREKEMIGMDKIEGVLKNSAAFSANDIISNFARLIDSWSGGVDPHDDITMMVLKKR